MNDRIELRTLTEDVTNPQHDRRKRYGEDAVEVFPRGMVFTARYTEDTINGEMVMTVTLEVSSTPERTIRRDTRVEGRRIVAALLLASEVKTAPDTWREVRAMHEAGDWEDRAVLQHLWEHGGEDTRTLLLGALAAVRTRELPNS